MGNSLQSLVRSRTGEELERIGDTILEVRRVGTEAKTEGHWALEDTKLQAGTWQALSALGPVDSSVWGGQFKVKYVGRWKVRLYK